MKNDELSVPRIPDWFPEALRVMRRIDTAIADLDGALSRATVLDGLDPRMGAHMERTREVLRTLDGTLTLMDATAGEIFERLFNAGTPGADFGADRYQAGVVYSEAR